MTQHSSLSADRWAAFPRHDQILMIGNEMHRAAKLTGPGDLSRVRRSYERVLRLVDLTVQTQPDRGLRRELLRWRDVVAGLYVSAQPDPAVHAAAFRCLLLLTPRSARQIPFLLPPP